MSFRNQPGLVELQLVPLTRPEIDSTLGSVQGRELAIRGRLQEAALAYDYTPVLLYAELLQLPDAATLDVRPMPSTPPLGHAGVPRRPDSKDRCQTRGYYSVNALLRDITSHYAEARWPVSPDSELKAMEAHIVPGDYAAVNFYLDCFELHGTQLRDTLDPSTPFKLWSVMGARGTLPRGVSLHATWRELRAAYGDRFTIDARGTVRFCSLTGFGFHLRGYLWMYPLEGRRPTPPPEAEISDVLIAPFDSTSVCDR